MTKNRKEGYGERIRRLLARGPVFAPGTFYPFGALQIKAAGFEACYVSGAAVSNSLGLIDEGYISREAMVWIVRRILKVADMPLVVDCDTGLLPEFKLNRLWELRQSMDEDAFIKLCLSRSDLVAGNDGFAVAETVKAMEKAGVAAIHIEDQDWCWKRCGHLDGKHLISVGDMQKKIREAVRARRGGMLIIARTDARAVEGFEGAAARARAYREAGADIIFPEALETLEEFRRFRQEVPDILLMANLVEQGKTTASLTAQDLAQAGYSLIIFPATGTRMMFYAFREFLDDIRTNGTSWRSVASGRLISRSRVNEFLKTHSRPYRRNEP